MEKGEWEDMLQDAWDDVHEGHNLDPERVKEGRKEGRIDVHGQERNLDGETNAGMLGTKRGPRLYRYVGWTRTRTGWRRVNGTVGEVQVSGARFQRRR